jgi:hypothetical protein
MFLLKLLLRLAQIKIFVGDCKHRPQNNNTCYVNVWQAPYNIFNAYKANRYDKLNKNNISLFKDRFFRIGSYGDPSVVPVNVWKNLLEHTSAHTRIYTCMEKL